MTSSSGPADAPGKRFLLRRYPEGGVVVALATGNVYRVNESAALVCEAVLSSDRPESVVAASLGIDTPEAKRLIDEVMAGLASPSVRSPPPGAYHFVAQDDGYGIQDGAEVVLAVDETGQNVRVLGDRDPREISRLEFYVRALAPKLLFRQGVTVLHASSCLSPDGRLTVFAGLSGAGKTTTARAFGQGPLQLISGDLVVLAGDVSPPRAALRAEVTIHEWARLVAARLREHPSGVRIGSLTHVAEGPSAPVAQVLLLDRTRRRGDRFEAVPLSPPDALVALLPHDFLGASETESWRFYFGVAGTLAASVPMAELWVPDGLERLAPAAAIYTTNWAS
jgi:hypothetical protein